MVLGLAIGFSLFVSFSNASAETLAGRVVALSDGDSITVLDAKNMQHKIRLSGIDAPEKRQAYGARSKQMLSDLVFNKLVSVEYKKFDRYDRVIGKVFVKGVDANLQLVKEGMAWHYKKYQKEQSASDRESYSRAEDLARSQKRGLWKDADAIPPWEFRAQKKERK